MSSDDARTIVERIAAWAERLRADPVAGHRWCRTAIRESGAAASGPPLVTVPHDAAHSPRDIAEALASAIADVVELPERGAASVRLYALDSDDAPLRHGWQVRVDAVAHRAAIATRAAATAPPGASSPEVEARLRALAIGQVLQAQAAHATTLHTHLDGVLSQTLAMVSAVTSSVGSTHALATQAVEAATARARLAEEARTRAERERDDAERELAEVRRIAERALAELASAEASAAGRENALRMLGRALGIAVEDLARKHGFAVGVNGARARKAHVEAEPPRATEDS